MDRRSLFISEAATVRKGAQSCSVRKGVLKTFPKFTGKHLCQSFFFNKVAGLEISKNTFFTEHLCATASRTSEVILVYLLRTSNIFTTLI